MEDHTTASPPSCTITATLVKVTELFLDSVKNLNASQTEYHLKYVMENYERMNMVMRVMKIAYPTAIETNHLTTSQPMVTPSPPPQIKVESDHYRDHSPVAPTTAPPPPPPKIISATTNQKPQSHISPMDFLKQFERTCEKFAAENNLTVDNIWESLIVHALPQDKMKWFENNILNRNLSWYDASQMYLKSFSARTMSPPPKQQQLAIRSDRSEERMARTLNPLPTPPPSEMDEEVVRKRQEKYAEYVLALEMRQYETITDYNKKFIRYVSIANIGLTQKDLIRRYLSSLLKEHRESMQIALKSDKQIQPKSIVDIMKLTEKVILSQQLVKDRIYAQPCWQMPSTTRKRELSEQQEGNPPKRFSSSCA